MKKNKKIMIILFMFGLIMSRMELVGMAMEAEGSAEMLLTAQEDFEDTDRKLPEAEMFFEIEDVQIPDGTDDFDKPDEPDRELLEDTDFFEFEEEDGELYSASWIEEEDMAAFDSGDYIFEEQIDESYEDILPVLAEGDMEDGEGVEVIPIVGVESILDGLNDDNQIVIGVPVTFEYDNLMNKNTALRQVLLDGGETTVRIRKSTGEIQELEPDGSTYSISALEEERLLNVCYWIQVAVEATGDVYESNIPFYVCPFDLASLTIEVEGQGTVTADRYLVPANSHIVLTITPDEGWYFEKMEAVAGFYTMVPGTENTISIGGNTTIRVVFKELVLTGSCGMDAAYSFDTQTGVLTISGTGAIADNAFYNDGIHTWDAVTSVVVGEGITKIGKWAFYYCGEITDVFLPEGLTVIGEHGFNVCKKLETINLPKSLLRIGEAAFSQCYALHSITLPEGLETIGNYAFSLSDLFEVTVPSSVTYLGNSAFGNNKNMTAAVINAQITSLPASCFDSCAALQNVTLPDTLEKIDAYAFNSCVALKTVTLPENVTIFGDRVFVSCKGLKSMTLPEGTAEVSRGMFGGCIALETVNLPESLKTIGSSAFEGCSALQSIVIPESVTFIADRAFGSCTKLAGINLPAGISKICDTCFWACEALTSIVIPEGVTEIEYGAFQNSGLMSIELPSTLTKIGESAFYMGNKGKMLGTLTIPASVTEIGKCAFYSSDFSTITNLSSQSFSLSTILRSTSFPSEAINIYLDSEGEEVETIGTGTYTKKVSEIPGDDPGSGGSDDPGSGGTEDPGSEGCAHSWSEIIEKATLTTSGGIYRACSKCGRKELVTPLAAVTSITLETDFYVYDGAAKRPAVLVKNAAGDVLAADQYSVTYSQNLNAGMATASVALKSKWYEGTRSLTFRIVKAANPLKPAAKTASVKYSKVRRKDQTLAVTKVIKFTGKGQGTMKYTLSSAKKGKKSFKKYFRINTKTGKVTVKKGLKKGTYKVKIKVTAAGNANYMPSSVKTVTCKIKVK